MKDRPNRIALVIPTLNEETHIGLLLETLAHQTYRNFEVVVVDSNSIDRTCEVVEKYRDRLPSLKIVQTPEKGLSRARNIGVRESKAEDILFMDADGKVAVDFLEDLVLVMRTMELKAAATLVKPDSTKLFDRFFYGILMGWGLRIFQYFFPVVTGSSLIVQREIFEQAGGFDTTIHFEDSAFARKVARIGRFRILPHPVVTTSVRRLDRDGRFKTLLKLFFFGILGRLLTGEMKLKKDFYQFGQYNRSLQEKQTKSPEPSKPAGTGFEHGKTDSRNHTGK